MSFLYSESGNAKALLIGINYNGQKGELRGCINDTDNIKEYLLSKCNYAHENICVITDDTNTKPTKANILDAISNFVDEIHSCGAKNAWFSYSGHGSYVDDLSFDETDEHDEVLVPIDYQGHGMITDDMLYDLLVTMLPLDCKLFCIVDACHSGTSMDLPYKYDKKNKTCVLQKQTMGPLGQVIKLSGCRDTQTSADAFIDGQYQGALTSSFISHAKEHSSLSMLDNVHEDLFGTFTQLPVLTCTASECLDIPLLPLQPNVHISLTVDKWYKETVWNIVDMVNGKMIFDKNQIFTSSLHTIKNDIYLKPSTYLIYMFDTYGDGGVVGSISDIQAETELLQVSFQSDKVYSKAFEIK